MRANVAENVDFSLGLKQQYLTVGLLRRMHYVANGLKYIRSWQLPSRRAGNQDLPVQAVEGCVHQEQHNDFGIDRMHEGAWGHGG